MSISRRDCLMTGLAAVALARRTLAKSSALTLEQTVNPDHRAIPAKLRVAGDCYVWTWAAADDRFRIEDMNGREIASAPLQPLLLLQIAGKPLNRPGTLQSVTVSDDRAEFVYALSEISATAVASVRFATDRCWFEPVQLVSETAADVIELRWFSIAEDGVAVPALSNHYLISPGFSMSDGISPIVTAEENLDETVWLGRGATGSQRMFQQWGLPVHYFAGYNREGADGERGSVPGKLSAAFCCGLESVPNADMLLHTRSGQHSLIFSYHSELWGQARTPGKVSLGGRLVWTFGVQWREAIRAYYLAVRDAGAISTTPPNAPKREAMTGTVFSMWGAQVASGNIGGKLDQTELEDIYQHLRGTGMKVDTFLIEDRWESFPGSLIHDAQRFPRFDAFLDRLRTDRVRAALWVTPLRCQSPELVGLTRRHLLSAPTTTYSILDVSQPEVAENITRRLQAMMRRYRPGFIKFDFGYEMPALSVAAPADRAFAGERLLLKAAEVLSGAVRAVDANVVILYYGLSPFMVPYTDLHSPDDAFAAGGDYDIEINRRIYFSSPLGELGMPTYGSGGYDWQTMPSIWFDSVLSGPLGIIADPRGDERGQRPTPEMTALFNGLRAATRHNTVFSIDTVPTDPISPVQGARSPSWIRREHGVIVGLAMRHEPWMGAPGISSLAGLLEAKMSVVVTSRTADALAHSSELAIVPLADGQVRLRRAHRAQRLVITDHFADGSRSVRTGQVRDKVCAVDLKIRSPTGVPLEWCQLQFHAD